MSLQLAQVHHSSCLALGLVTAALLANYNIVYYLAARCCSFLLRALAIDAFVAGLVVGSFQVSQFLFCLLHFNVLSYSLASFFHVYLLFVKTALYCGEHLLGSATLFLLILRACWLLLKIGGLFVLVNHSFLFHAGFVVAT